MTQEQFGILQCSSAGPTFDVGEIGTGLLQCFTLGGLFIWAGVDLIPILVGGFRDKQGLKVVKWIDYNLPKGETAESSHIPLATNPQCRSAKKS
jgi:hypothetical protein